MTSYILILIMSNGSGMAMTQAYFPSKEGCESAGRQYVQTLYSSWSHYPRYICLERK